MTKKQVRMNYSRETLQLAAQIDFSSFLLLPAQENSLLTLDYDWA